jgi:hypothetical protein
MVTETQVLKVVRNTSQQVRPFCLALLVAVSAGCGVAWHQSNVEEESGPYQFHRALSWQSYDFDVSASGEKLTIKAADQILTDTIDGIVTGAEVGDLNLDGYPELLVFVTSAGSGSYGSVIGYSSNAGKSMSRMNTALATENPKYSNGYMGHDKLALVEGTLVQAFPVYRKGDLNFKPTGPTRQIQYKMVDGEAVRQLVVAKVLEY